MNTMQTMKRVITGVLLAGGVVTTGLGPGAGVAHAYTYGPFQWCPGQAMPNDPPRQAGDLVWDMSVCHTYWFEYDVRTKAPARYWEGENLFPTPIAPPPAAPLPADCPPWSPILAPSRCGGL